MSDNRPDALTVHFFGVGRVAMGHASTGVAVGDALAGNWVFA